VPYRTIAWCRSVMAPHGWTSCPCLWLYHVGGCAKVTEVEVEQRSRRPAPSADAGCICCQKSPRVCVSWHVALLHTAFLQRPCSQRQKEWKRAGVTMNQDMKLEVIQAISSIPATTARSRQYNLWNMTFLQGMHHSSCCVRLIEISPFPHETGI